ncbi:hypothetical protein EK21DRAFT_67474, partial [Setomelanomma holmii]
VWIHAMCIDQSNSEERTHQVQLMRRIYEQPLERVVYLGEYEPDETSDWFMRHDNHSYQLPGDEVGLWDRELIIWKGDESDNLRIQETLYQIRLWDAS